MDLNKIFTLIERIEGVCPPESKVEIVPTDQEDDLYLVIVQPPTINITTEKWKADIAELNSRQIEEFFERNPSLIRAYIWEKQEIHSLHYEKILPLLKDAGNFRVVYCCENQFVFYARTFGCLQHCINIVDYLGLKTKDMEDYQYTGVSKDIDVFISYLMSNI